MSEVGIRELKQNASAVVARATGGDTVTITDRGRRVAQLTALSGSRLSQLLASGDARPAERAIADLSDPLPGPDLTAELLSMRESERY